MSIAVEKIIDVKDLADQMEYFMGCLALCIPPEDRQRSGFKKKTQWNPKTGAPTEQITCILRGKDKHDIPERVGKVMATPDYRHGTVDVSLSIDKNFEEPFAHVMKMGGMEDRTPNSGEKTDATEPQTAPEPDSGNRPDQSPHSVDGGQRETDPPYKTGNDVSGSGPGNLQIIP